MISLLDKENDIVGYLDGDTCKDLDNKILGYIKRDDDNPQLSYILSEDMTIRGQLCGNEFKGNDGTIYGRVVGHDLIGDYNNELLGHVKINDPQESKNVARAGAVLFFFFGLMPYDYIRKHKKKARQGNVTAQYNLAILYLT